MGVKSVSDKLERLRESGVNVWSFSRLGNFDTCPNQFKLSYIDEVENKQNVYGSMGGVLHEGLEEIHLCEDKGKEYLSEVLEGGYLDLELGGLRFPTEQIENGWKANISHYVDNFEKKYDKSIVEKQVLYNFKEELGLNEDLWVVGYVDLIVPSKQSEGQLTVVDWKTSSKFAGKKLKEAGRQLILYAYILEKTTGRKVSNVAWEMLKYINVCCMQKNGKVKKTMTERRKWVDAIRNKVEKELYLLEFMEFEVEMYIDDMLHDKNLDKMPKSIRDMFWLEDSVVEYDYNQEKVEELFSWMKGTIEGVKESDFEAVEINRQTSFFCTFLCGVRGSCASYQEYKNSLGAC